MQEKTFDTGVYPGQTFVRGVTLTDVKGGAGAASLHTTSAATTNATLVQAGATRLVGMYAINTTASAKFIRLYDKATAPNPAADSALVKRTFMVKPNDTLNLDRTLGVLFSLGLGFTITGAAPDADATAVAAGDVIFDIEYA